MIPQYRGNPTRVGDCLPQLPVGNVGNEFQAPDQIGFSAPIGADQEVQPLRMPIDFLQRPEAKYAQFLNSHHHTHEDKGFTWLP